MKVAVPWLQHSQRFGHCALSQTVCNRKSEISALVEKKTGFDGNRTLIQGGFCAWCRAGSIFAQDISKKSYNVKNVTKAKSPGGTLNVQQGRIVRITSRTYSNSSDLAKLPLRALLRTRGQQTQLLDCSRLRRSNFSGFNLA